MDTPIRSFPSGDLRVSDADRDSAVADLGEHFQAGRLTQEEFEDRSARALQARTGADLGELFTDLPQRAAPMAGMPPAAARCGRVCRGGRVPTVRFIIAFVIAAIVAGNVLGNVFGSTNVHVGGFGWLVPVIILGLVLRSMPRRR